MVRVVNDRAEAVYFATPPGWTDFDLSSLDTPRRSPSPWQAIADPTGGAVLELGSVDLPYGVTVQVGRSSHVRDELLRRFRERALQMRALVVLVAAIGGGLLYHRRPAAPPRAGRDAAADPAHRPVRRACARSARTTRSISSGRSSTRCWAASRRSSAACTAPSTTSPTICARRSRGSATSPKPRSLTNDPARLEGRARPRPRGSGSGQCHAHGAHGHLAGRDRDDAAGIRSPLTCGR